MVVKLSVQFQNSLQLLLPIFCLLSVEQLEKEKIQRTQTANILVEEAENCSSA